MTPSNRPYCRVTAAGRHHLLAGRVLAFAVDGHLLVWVDGETVEMKPQDVDLLPTHGVGGTPTVGDMVEICTDRGEPLGIKRGQLGRVVEVDLPGGRAHVRTRGLIGAVTVWGPMDELHRIGGAD